MEAKVAATAVKSSLQVENVGMIFDRDGQQTNVLEDISLEVGEGEFVCLLGPSGCGKSTLLNIMAGFLSPTRGDVKVGGEIVHGPDPRRIFVFQERGVFPWLTVEGNIGFGIAGLPRKEREQRIAHYVQMVGLEGFEKSYPLTSPEGLNSGSRARVPLLSILTCSCSTSPLAHSTPSRASLCVGNSCASGKRSERPSSSSHTTSMRRCSLPIESSS